MANKKSQRGQTANNTIWYEIFWSSIYGNNNIHPIYAYNDERDIHDISNQHVHNLDV